ncbi:MAG: hypothetical protein BM556_13125 [Bacteriovorax sp. MedPE-SWde]|nr:MAG: hypothetical protein BM556_13125 [Bacteriovorax sp. MedPE-SWde]
MRLTVWFMKVSDYSGQLSEMREGHQNSVAKLKKSYESQIKNINETNDLLMDEMRENNQSKRKVLEDENQDKIEVINKKTVKLLEERRDGYKSKIADQRDGFREDRMKLSEGFQNKLFGIKNSYDEALAQHKYTSEQQLDNTKENLNRKMEIKDKNSQGLIDEIQDKSKVTVKQLRDDMTSQKKSLVKLHRADSDAVMKEHGKNVREVKDYYDDKFEKVVTNHKSEFDRSNARYETELARSRSDDRGEIDHMTDTFNRSVTRMENASQRDYKSLQEKFAKDRATQLREGQEQVYFLNKEKDEIMDRSLRGEGVEFQKQEIRDGYEARLDGMRELMFDQRIKFEKDLEEMDKHVDGQVKERNFVERQNMDRMKEDFNNNLYRNIERNRKEQVTLEKSYNRELRNKDTMHEESSLRDSKFYKNLLNRQREHFGDNVIKLENSNLQNVRDLQSEYAIEKKDIAEMTRKSVEQTMKNQREEFNRKVDKIVESYEQKFKAQEAELARTKDYSLAKLDRLSKNSQIKQESESKFYNEMQTAQKNENKTRIQDMQKDFDRSKKELKSRFDNEVAKIRRENDVHNTKLVRKYEGEKQQDILNHQHELKSKMNQAHAKLERVMKDAEYQKNRMVENYETRIKDLKRAYELEKVKDYQS